MGKQTGLISLFGHRFNNYLQFELLAASKSIVSLSDHLLCVLCV